MTKPLTYPQAVDKARSETMPGELFHLVKRDGELWRAHYWKLGWYSGPARHSRKDVPIGLVATPSQ